MLQQIAIYTIFGQPLFLYFGLAALAGFSLTAAVPWLSKRRPGTIKFAWHPRLAKISFTLAVVHALLALSLYI